MLPTTFDRWESFSLVVDDQADHHKQSRQTDRRPDCQGMHVLCQLRDIRQNEPIKPSKQCTSQHEPLPHCLILQYLCLYRLTDGKHSSLTANFPCHLVSFRVLALSTKTFDRWESFQSGRNFSREHMKDHARENHCY